MVTSLPRTQRVKSACQWLVPKDEEEEEEAVQEGLRNSGAWHCWLRSTVKAKMYSVLLYVCINPFKASHIFASLQSLGN